MTNSLVYGSSRQNTVFEYLQEVQVKTGGIDAEYGGALGGVISAVTKSGGNTFHGEGHYYFSGNPISAGPVQRLVLSPVDDKTVSFRSGRQADAAERARRFDRRTDCQGQVVLLRLGLAPHCPAHKQLRVLERHRTGLDQSEPDGHAGVRQGHLHQSRVQANVSVLSTPTRSTGTLPAYNGTRSNGISTLTRQQPAQTSLAASSMDQNNVSGNVDFWLSQLGTTSPSAAVTSTTTTPTPAFRRRPSVPGIRRRSASPACRRACSSRRDQNTPRVADHQLGQTKTGLFQVDYNHSFTRQAPTSSRVALASATRQRRGLVYPGGFVLIVLGHAPLRARDRASEGNGQVRLLRGRRPRHPRPGRAPICRSLYVQDAWTIGNRLTLNLGVRSERETIPSFRPEIKAQRVRVRVRREDRAAARRHLRCARRRQGSRCSAAGAATTTGSSTSWHAARSAATSGRSTIARSTRSTSSA